LLYDENVQVKWDYILGLKFEWLVGFFYFVVYKKKLKGKVVLLLK
jgi:hypothetical protein